MTSCSVATCRRRRPSRHRYTNCIEGRLDSQERAGHAAVRRERSTRQGRRAVCDGRHTRAGAAALEQWHLEDHHKWRPAAVGRAGARPPVHGRSSGRSARDMLLATDPAKRVASSCTRRDVVNAIVEELRVYAALSPFISDEREQCSVPENDLPLQASSFVLHAS
ncbi:hypothetical protein BC826DRAFT_67124 [Russula brevipes]|nr:hypothetical protein BC826DRAFT_67124 [Russula brevipes]